jgi:RNA polymerase sigma-70 factor, ECF subfamily
MVHLQAGAPEHECEANLIRRAASGEAEAVRSIIKTYNRRLYRVVRSITRNDADAEDVLQDAYLKAFRALANFRGDSSLSTWLTRIALNEALQHQRRRVREPVLPNVPPRTAAEIIPFPLAGGVPLDPERTMAQRQLCELLERAIDDLPEDFRTVLVARTIEGMTVEETAALFGIRPETVKTRLHRARRLLKIAVADAIGPLLSDAFPFAGRRCEQLTDAVLKRLELSA